MADKNRKPEEQKQYEQADNAGVFGDTGRNDDRSGGDRMASGYDQSGNSDRDAHRDPNQVHDLTKDAQNVADDNVSNIQPLGNETEHARNKATEGQRQNRNDDQF